METKNFKKSLQSTLKTASIIARDIKHKEITVDLLIHAAFVLYETNPTVIRESEPEFEKSIIKMAGTNLFQLTCDISEIIINDKASKFEFPMETFSKVLYQSDDLLFILESANRSSYKLTSPKIGIVEVILAIMNNPTLSKSIKCLNDANISEKELRDFIDNNKSQLSHSGTLGERRINTDPSQFENNINRGLFSPEEMSEALKDPEKLFRTLDKIKDALNNGDLKGGPNDPPQSKRNPDDFEKAGTSGGISSRAVDPNSLTPCLDEFAYDMNKAALEGKYDPVIGRDNEISQIIEIICCRKKNNAVLLGDPGCGKTAIVEHLVQRIIEQNVPEEIKNKRIFALDLNALVSGTKFRGEYEERLQKIIVEVCNNPDIIVYIDEFHNLVGNGGSSESGDGANILKPYLARGEFQCIGSTTSDEYRKIIEKDGALKRRFQNVQINEPNIAETVEILKSISSKYSMFHKVRYTEEVVKACAEWSGRYIIDRFFPDKAIDIFDMAGSLAKLNVDPTTRTPLPSEITKVQLDELNSKKKKAIIDQDFELANKYKTETDKLKKIFNKQCEKESLVLDTSGWPEVTLDQVAKVISKTSKVPVDKIFSSGQTKLKEMKTKLENKVIGQDEAVKKITTSLQRNFLGLRDVNKPISTMLLVGPTGTGKTLICKEIAKEFFGNEKALIKFDMTEFSERHEITKLTGATASYVGYNDTPLLEQVRRNPYSVILFDEIEKAHSDIYNVFLSILDEGYITLGNGIKVDFKNTVIIFTGNVGTKELSLRGNGLGFSGNDDLKKTTTNIVMKAVEKEFRPEFINRLSEIVVFNNLGKPELSKIFELEFNKLKDRLLEKNITVTVSDAIKNKIVDDCNPKYGARDLQRNIIKYIENEICQAALDFENFEKIDSIHVDFTEKIEVMFKEKKESVSSTAKRGRKSKKTDKSEDAVEVSL